MIELNSLYEPENGAATPEPGGISGKVNIIEPDARHRARTCLEQWKSGSVFALKCGERCFKNLV